MEFYRSCFTQQLAPLVAVVLDPSHRLQLFAAHLNKANILGKIWDDSIIKNRLLKAKYIFRYFEDEQAVSQVVSTTKAKTEGSTIHLPLSPFNVDSDLFPNGIISSRWFEKYTEHLVAAVICSYKLPANPAEDEALALQLANQREKYSVFDVKFIAIIVSETEDEATVCRVAQLRHISGLPRSLGLFHIFGNSVSGSSNAYERDSEILAATLISTLKAICTDFYFAIEHRVERRTNKYYTVPDSSQIDTQIGLLSSFLGVRNGVKRAILTQLMHPHNVEGSLSIMEQAYAGLIILLEQHQEVFESAQVSDHDRALYTQWRTLIDVLALYLVRGYFSIEEPVAALRKHKAHIKNVSRSITDSVELELWTAIQYHWLADLMSLIPQGILNDLYKLPQGKLSLTRSVYFGGIAFHDSSEKSIVTLPSLIYFKAANSIQKVQVKPGSHFSSALEVRNYKISLLLIARTLLKDQAETFVGFQNYLNWQIAEEYYVMGDLSGSDEVLRIIQNSSRNIPKYLLLIVQQRRIQILLDKGDVQDLAKAYVEHIIQSPELEVTSKCFSNLLGEYSLRLELQPLLEIEPLLYSKSEDEDYVLSPIISQLKVQPKPWLLGQSIGNLELEKFSVIHVKLTYENGQTILISSDGTQDTQVQDLDITDPRFNAAFLKNGLLILRFEEVSTASGWHGICKIEVEMDLRFNSGSAQFLCKHSEIHDFSKPSLQNSALVYSLKPGGVLLARARLLRGRPSTRIHIKPYRPDISLICEKLPSTPIIEEKVTLNVEISRKTLPVMDIAFKEVLVEVSACLSTRGQVTPLFYIQHNWDQQKDDVALNLLDFFYSKSMLTSKCLRANVRRSPGVDGTNEELEAHFLFRLVVTEESDVVSSYEVGQMSYNVLTQAFDASITISSKLANSHMPSPFILALINEDYSMPQPARLWSTKMVILDHSKLIERGEIEVESAQITMKPKSAEVSVSFEGALEQSNESFLQVFSVRSKTHVSHNSIPITVQGVINWRRSQGDTGGTFVTKEMNYLISAQEPRALLEATPLSTNTIELRYILENPTPRILTFATNLVTERAALHGTEWTFNDIRNVTPMKQLALPILPFSLHHMVFYGTFVKHGRGSAIELPHMQVQDMNYKVELVTKSLHDNVIETDKALVYQVA